MIDEKKLIEQLEVLKDKCWNRAKKENNINFVRKQLDICQIIGIINNQPKIGEWILCSEKLPENEQDVEITYTRQHYSTGETLYFTARAFYEDGTYTTEDSGYSWEEMDNWKYDEKTDAYIIPQGWFESVSFAERFEAVDMPVIAWRPIPKPYKLL